MWIKEIVKYAVKQKKSFSSSVRINSESALQINVKLLQIRQVVYTIDESQPHNKRLIATRYGDPHYRSFSLKILLLQKDQDPALIEEIDAIETYYVPTGIWSRRLKECENALISGNLQALLDGILKIDDLVKTHS